jgi:hypothetical protein
LLHEVFGLRQLIQRIVRGLLGRWHSSSDAFQNDCGSVVDCRAYPQMVCGHLTWIKQPRAAGKPKATETVLGTEP